MSSRSSMMSSRMINDVIYALCNGEEDELDGMNQSDSTI